MAYGSNLIINPSAETQDTTGWTVSGVTVEENITAEITYSHIINDADGWLGEYDHKLTVVGPAGDYAFILEDTASMQQILYASDIGATPDSFQFVISFQLITQQNLWDSNVLAKALAKFEYDDGTIDYFMIPLIKGLSHVDRNLFNWWLKTILICAMDNTKIITQVTIKIETLALTDGLKVDYIELRKEI